MAKQRFLAPGMWILVKEETSFSSMVVSLHRPVPHPLQGFA